MKRFAAGVSFGVAMAILVTGLSGSGDEGQKNNDPALASARALRSAAKKAYEQSVAMQNTGIAFEPEQLYRWSVRWSDAERAMARTDGERIAALNKHLERMQSLKSAFQRQVELGVGVPLYVASAEYYTLEGESWLAAAKSAVKGNPKSSKEN